MKLEYSIVLKIVADLCLDEKETDIKKALVGNTGIYARHCLFNLSESGKLLKYTNRISVVYDSYKDFTEKVEEDIKYYIQRDLGNYYKWNVQATIETQSFNTPI